MTVAAAEIKSCCAAAYSSAAAGFLLGDSFHPGGRELTSRLIRQLGVGTGSTVVDVASGRGTSALLLARELDCDVVGVDLSPTSVAAAADAAMQAGLAGQVRFIVGDAEALPLEDASVDGALCECALCTFPDKEAAVSELARVLRPRAVLVLADIVAEPERLPDELRSLAAWVACVADAKPIAELSALLQRAGFAIEKVERHDGALARLLEILDARLRTAALVWPELSADGLAQGRDLVQAARDALSRGSLGYGSILARLA
jgi:ubiquinone/menaquinone biosynthesis C-methylase UbiE